jgi:hypothetical protein
MSVKIIINADDFGLKSSVNNAIAESFNNGLINSVTLMANMPGFEEAVELAHRSNFTNEIGIHLNLDSNYLLTSNIIITRLFDKKNHFNFINNRTNLFFISKEEKNLIYKEFAAQIERVKKAGINITHIDSHHHIHEIWSITKIMLALLKEYKIASVRILNNLNRSTNFYKLGYRKLVNKFIKINNANFSDFFGDQLQVKELLIKHPSIYFYEQIEVMVHPDYNSKGIIIDKINGQELNFEYPKFLAKLFWGTNISEHIEK